MKNLPAIAACCAAALVAGCESGIPDSVKSALGPREEPRNRVFPSDQKTTYEAALQAADQMGYRFVRGGPAEGELDELSAISTGDEVGSSRQVSMKVRLEPGPATGTQVTVSFSEIIEADSNNQPGMATETPLRDTPQYDVFFRDLQRCLQPKADASN